MEKENNNQIYKKIIEKIEKGEIKMRPKIYFLTKAFFFFVGIIFLFMLVMFLASLAIFILRANNMFFLAGFGFSGFMIVFKSFPWYLVLLIALLIFLIEIMGKKFPLVYKKPLIYSFFGVVLFVIVGSVMLDASFMHRRFFEMAQRKELPIGEGMYNNFGRIAMDGIYEGTLLEKDEKELKIETWEGEVLTIEINSDTKIMRGGEELKINDKIVVLGREENKRIIALGIHKIDGYLRDIKPQKMMNRNPFPDTKPF
jgi:hypothetical protein